ncbi:zinc finger and BTB domain-containing protein 37 [Aplochiton taeniatus]
MDRTGSIQLDIPDFSNSVLSHLNQLRVQGRLCDIVVNVQGQSFRAHKVVLAASSPYFRDHMSLSQMSTVSLSVIRNPSVFEQLLTFCYTGRLCLQLADIISYLTAASFLQMQHVIDRCTQILEGIHLKISLANVEDMLEVEVAKGHKEGETLEAVVKGVLGGAADCSRVPSIHHGNLRVHGLRSDLFGVEMERHNVISPPDESMSPQVVEHSGLGPGEQAGRSAPASRLCKEPILRINRAGQWYVETFADSEKAGSGDEGDGVAVRAGVADGVKIKTERMEEWMETETPEEGSGAEEGSAMTNAAPGRGALEADGFLTKSTGAKRSQHASSLSETGRFSPKGSAGGMPERQRAKSESPSKVDDMHHPTSKGEDQAAFDIGGYEEYLREQVGDRWFRYNPRLTCIYCCKSFNQKGSLDRHMRLHMGITPFVCRICGKKYTRKDQLEYHIRKHTGNKPFHCHVCTKSFPFQAILNQHFRKNHPGCTPQEVAHSASPETTTLSVTSQGGQHDEVSPSQEEPEGGSGGGGSTFDEGPQASVSTTGPD